MSYVFSAKLKASRKLKLAPTRARVCAIMDEVALQSLEVCEKFDTSRSE